MLSPLPIRALSMTALQWQIHTRHLRNCSAVVSRVRSAKMDAVWGAHHGLAKTEEFAAPWSERQFMAKRLQLGTDVFRNEIFDCYITTFKCTFCEASGLESLLHVESIIGDVGHELRMRLGLIETTHNAKPDAYSVLLHESRNDGVQRPLARLQSVGMILYKIKESATVLQHKPCSRRYEA